MDEMVLNRKLVTVRTTSGALKETVSHGTQDRGKENASP